MFHQKHFYPCLALISFASVNLYQKIMTSEITNSHTSIKFDLKIHNFSNLGCKHKSDVFSVGNIKWRVKVYPKGDSRSWNHMAIYLIPDDKTKSPYAEFSFVIKSQTSSRNNEKGPDLYYLGYIYPSSVNYRY